MNEHFVIYENAMYDESFEKQIMNGDFSTEQLREKLNTISGEQLKIVQDNIKFSGKYPQDLVEEFLNFSPRQRGWAKTGADKVAGALGFKKAGAKNQLIKIYQQVWKEYLTYARKQQGLGNNTPNTLKTAMSLLKSLGINDAVLNKVIAANFRRTNPNKPIDNKIVGSFIYKVLQNHYQESSAADDTNYQLPTSI